MWLVGIPRYRKENGELAPIMPFRLSNPGFLPKIIANQFKLSWRPIFVKTLEEAEIPTLNEQCLNHQMLELTFNIATDHLKANVCSYVWERYSNLDNLASEHMVKKD